MPKNTELKLYAAVSSVQWVGENDGHRIGRVVFNPEGFPVEDKELGMVLIREYHTGDLFLVDPNVISPYPSTLIPEPTK
jgi:hypothetical protein